jgi:hypothetical protein
MADTDVIGYGQSGLKACFAVLHYSGGMLLDKEYEVFQAPEDPESALSSLIKQYYLSRGAAPKVVLLPFLPDSESVDSRRFFVGDFCFFGPLRQNGYPSPTYIRRHFYVQKNPFTYPCPYYGMRCTSHGSFCC